VQLARVARDRHHRARRPVRLRAGAAAQHGQGGRRGPEEGPRGDHRRPGAGRRVARRRPGAPARPGPAAVPPAHVHQEPAAGRRRAAGAQRGDVDPRRGSTGPRPGHPAAVRQRRHL
ncbi:MAG: Twin-arginine translocation protein TatB, partial [uncultured Quadrisphaera sp.]